jgi:ABC-2 type transport system permease protein
MKAWFENELGATLITSNDRERLESELLNNNISGIAELPKGFQDALLTDAPKPVELTFTDDYVNKAFMSAYFEAYMASVSVLAAAADGNEAVFEQMLKETGRSEHSVTAVRQDAGLARQEAEKETYWFMIGFFMMFSFMMSIIISQMLHTDRLDGTFRRIRASSVTSAEYVASIAVIGFIISLLIEGPALLVWRATGSYSGVPAGVTVLMLFAFAVLVNSFGIFVGIVMPSFSGIVAVVIAVSTITSMLGGAWFPMDLAPPLFKTLSRFTPQYWVHEALYSYEGGSGAIGIPLALLLLASLLLLLLAGIRFQSNRGNARALSR